MENTKIRNPPLTLVYINKGTKLLLSVVSSIIVMDTYIRSRSQYSLLTASALYRLPQGRGVNFIHYWLNTCVTGEDGNRAEQITPILSQPSKVLCFDKRYTGFYK